MAEDLEQNYQSIRYMPARSHRTCCSGTITALFNSENLSSHKLEQVMLIVKDLVAYCLDARSSYIGTGGPLLCLTMITQ